MSKLLTIGGAHGNLLYAENSKRARGRHRLTPLSSDRGQVNTAEHWVWASTSVYSVAMPEELSVPLGRTHEFTLVIHEGHLDTFGHVNNAKYLELFEQARWDWITTGGYGLSKIQETQKGPVILECSLQFRREVTNRQTVSIRSWIDKVGPKVSMVRQELSLHASPAEGDAPNRARDLCCAASFKMAFFDLSARRIIEPTADWLQALGLNTTS